MRPARHVQVWLRRDKRKRLSPRQIRGRIAARLVLHGLCEDRDEALRYVTALLTNKEISKR